MKTRGGGKRPRDDGEGHRGGGKRRRRHVYHCIRCDEEVETVNHLRRCTECASNPQECCVCSNVLPTDDPQSRGWEVCRSCPKVYCPKCMCTIFSKCAPFDRETWMSARGYCGYCE
mgnify:CR=1 FL=1